MKLYVFTKKDIDRFLTECNFTPDEEKLFRLRCKKYTLEYYNAVLDEMRGGYNDDYSERGRKRDSMGRYSSNDGRMMPDYDRGSSYARRGEHYVRGHYSRSDGRDAYDDYMTQKQSYRSGKSEDCKRKMLAALEEHLDELTTEMSDMSKDAKCREERGLVKRYVEKLRDML